MDSRLGARARENSARVASVEMYSSDVDAIRNNGRGETLAINSALLNEGSWGGRCVIDAPISVQCHARTLTLGVPMATKPSKIAWFGVSAIAARPRPAPSDHPTSKVRSGLPCWTQRAIAPK